MSACYRQSYHGHPHCEKRSLYAAMVKCLTLKAHEYHYSIEASFLTMGTDHGSIVGSMLASNGSRRESDPQRPQPLHHTQSLMENVFSFLLIQKEQVVKYWQENGQCRLVSV